MMGCWEICYECNGTRYLETIEDPGYGASLSALQLAQIRRGLIGESDDHVQLLWWRPLDAGLRSSGD